MSTPSSRALLAVLAVLVCAGCADFGLEKRRLCERFPERCESPGNGDETPEAGDPDSGTSADSGTSQDAGGPPRVTDRWPLMPMAQPGGLISFQVTAEVPPAGSLRFEWSATLGTLIAQEDSETTSDVFWTAPSCLASGTPPFVSVTLTNSLGPSSSVQFLVGGLPDCPAWRPSGTLSASRQDFTATVLADGRILVVGGRAPSTALASADLHDPVTGTVSPTGAMAVARWGHTATLLGNGQVLVAGGRDANDNVVRSAELYNPVTGTWSPTGNMAAGRHLHTAVWVNSKVYVAGGADSLVSLNTAEVYDPSAGTWSAAAPLPQHRHGHTATLLSNSSKILVVGGTRTYLTGGGTPVSEALATAALYDPSANTWSSTGTMAQARGSGHSATLLGSGKVLVLAGTGSSAPLATGELYDPATHAWAPIQAMAPPGRTGHGASLLGSGKVLVTGGSHGNPLQTAELYDPERNTWSSTVALSASRTGHAAITLPQGDALVLGGGVASVERYEAGTGVWKPAGSMSSVRYRHTVTLLPSGKVLVVGGVDVTDSRLATTEVFNPLSGRWTRSGNMTTPRESHTATLLPSGRVLVTGGTAANAPAELYDPLSGIWTTTGAMNLNRSGHTATLLSSGRVLVAGGTGGFASAELYDPGAGTWVYTANMTEGRTAHTATLLPSGSVLVTGGDSDEPLSVGTAAAEVFDAERETWSKEEDMLVRRRAHTATLLPSSQVLIVGGFYLAPGGRNLQYSSTQAVDSYDPRTGLWAAVAGMNAGGFMISGRHDHATVLLPDGRVLVTGGVTRVPWNPNIIITNATSEVYNPGLDTWTPTSRTTGARAGGHRALLLPTGRVLVTGGTNDTGAELYIP